MSVELLQNILNIIPRNYKIEDYIEVDGNDNQKITNISKIFTHCHTVDYSVKNYIQKHLHLKGSNIFLYYNDNMMNNIEKPCLFYINNKDIEKLYNMYQKLYTNKLDHIIVIPFDLSSNEINQIFPKYKQILKYKKNILIYM